MHNEHPPVLLETIMIINVEFIIIIIIIIIIIARVARNLISFYYLPINAASPNP